MPYVIARQDGGVSVMRPTRPMDDEEVTLEIARSALPSPAVSFIWIPESALPKRDIYRDAWASRDGAVHHDMRKAREIHRNSLRRQRAPLLAQLDVESMRAIEGKDDLNLREVVLRKQALRDAPADPRIDMAQSVEELKLVTIDPAVAVPASRDVDQPLTVRR